MKSKVLIGGMVWVVLITLAHIHANVGWSTFLADASEALGLREERQELVVGFLPVT